MQTSNQHTQNNNFVQTKLNPLPPCLPPHGRLAHVRSQFSLFRRSPTHKNLPPATFCTSERAFWLLFARRKKYQSVLPCRELRGSTNLDSAHPNNNFAQTKFKPFLKGDSRFCKPRISPLKRQLRTNPIKSFAAPRAFSPPRLLETWSPCSRPFAILPVSAVSDAQKLATGNFLHVRAAFPAAKPPFCVACGGNFFLLFVKYKK